MLRPVSRRLPLLFGLAALLPAAHAQVPISGSVYDGSGGPLLSGQVYHAVGDVLVPPGRVLTIQPDVVIKFASGALLVGGGDVRTLGTASQPVVLTSWADDTVAGDSWGDGATTGTPGDWGGVSAGAFGSVDFDHTTIRFGGSGGWSPVTCVGGDITLRDCVLEESSAAGLDLLQYEVSFLVEDCLFRNNTGWAVDQATMPALAGFSGNTASGNGSGDAVFVTATTLGSDVTVVEDDLPNGTLALFGDPVIQSGVTLTLGAGVTIKHVGNSIWDVSGALKAFGTGAEPVAFTSLTDDGYGGDTTNNGPSSGTPGQWRTIDVAPGGELDLTDTVIRYAGSSGFPAVSCLAGELTLIGCTIEKNGGDGLDLTFSEATLDVQDCAFDDNFGWPIDNVMVHDVPEFLNNTASGNFGGNAMTIGYGDALQDVDIRPENLVGGCLVMFDDIAANPGVAITLHAGTVFKGNTNVGFLSWGTIQALGTEAEPIVFTSLADDTVAGDTDLDGPTTGTPGDWVGIQSLAGGAVELEHVEVRYSGAAPYDAIYSSGGAVVLRHSLIRDSFGSGLSLYNLDVPCEVVDCDFENNFGYAAEEVLLPVLQGFDSNRASGNLLGDYVHVTDGLVPRPTRLGPRNTIGGALVVQATVTVQPDIPLQLDAGTVIKWSGAGLLDASGPFEALGTAQRPVVFTTLEDDEHAGDTNGDGPSAGTPGSWWGMFSDFPGTLLMENVLIRYAGFSDAPGLRNTTFGGALRAVRVEHGQGVGFDLRGQLDEMSNLVAFSNGDDGIDLFHFGGPDLLHATSVGNGGYGIARDPLGTTLARNSISWGNALGNFNGFFPGQILFSNGAPDAPANSNLAVNPDFVDVANGDLHLAGISPLIDAADLSVALGVVRDADENSRILRSSSLGSYRPDMGAHEHSRWSLATGGQYAIGEPFSTTVLGAPGGCVHGLGLLDVSLNLPPYGFLLAGLNPLYVLTTAAVGTTRIFNIPSKPGLVGLELGLQAFAVDAIDVTFGHVTNVVRIELEPSLP